MIHSCIKPIVKIVPFEKFHFPCKVSMLHSGIKSTEYQTRVDGALRTYAVTVNDDNEFNVKVPVMSTTSRLSSY